LAERRKRGMKWSESQVKRLKELCYQGVSNKEIAADIGCALEDVYSKRSQLGITIAKCAALKASATEKRPKSKPKKSCIKPEHLDELRDDFNKVLNNWAFKHGYVHDSEAIAEVTDITRPEVTI
jgi:hypothetical protein